VGSSVWLHSPERKKGKSPKLSPRWEGQYVVVNHLNDVIVRIQRSPRAKPKIVHVNRLKAYHGNENLGWFAKAEGAFRTVDKSCQATEDLKAESLFPEGTAWGRIDNTGDYACIIM
jgi:hypothetical protein